jgi:hypothetical protein
VPRLESLPLACRATIAIINQWRNGSVAQSNQRPAPQRPTHSLGLFATARKAQDDRFAGYEIEGFVIGLEDEPIRDELHATSWS